MGCSLSVSVAPGSVPCTVHALGETVLALPPGQPSRRWAGAVGVPGLGRLQRGAPRRGIVCELAPGEVGDGALRLVQDPDDRARAGVTGPSAADRRAGLPSGLGNRPRASVPGGL